MKKVISLFLMLYVFSSTNAQTQSFSTNCLYHLCKVWGAAKYYHPNIASGKIDWDKSLLDILPKVRACKTPEEFNTVISELLGSAGKFKSKNPSKILNKKNIIRVYNSDWVMESDLLNKQNKDLLQNIISSYRKQKNHYRKTELYPPLSKAAEYLKNHFQGYDSIIKNPDLRAGILFAYFNIFEFLSPVNIHSPGRIDSLLIKSILNFEKATNLEKFESAVNIIVASINDGHCYPKYYTDKYYFPGILLKKAGNEIHLFEIISDSALLEIGQVTKIDNLPFDYLYDSISTLIGTENPINKEIIILNRITRKQKNDSILISYIDNKTNKIDEKTYLCSSSPKKYHNKSKNTINDEIGYIQMANKPYKEIKKLIRENDNKKAIILDFRNGYVNLPRSRLVSNFSTKNKLVMDMYYPMEKFPGIYKKFPNLAGKLYPLGNFPHLFKKRYKGEVVLLADYTSISNTELGLAYLKTATNGTIIGQKTVGVPASVVFAVPFGQTIQMYTYQYPIIKSIKTEKNMIVPDIEVPITDFFRDETFEYAVKFIEEKLKLNPAK